MASRGHSFSLRLAALARRFQIEHDGHGARVTKVIEKAHAQHLMARLLAFAAENRTSFEGAVWLHS